MLGLGAYGPPNIAQTGTVVDGNIVANAPATLYLSAMTVHGNLTSNGGGDPARNFPIKNLVVDGNVTLQGWSGLWIGLLRTQVGGNIVFSNNAGTQTGEGDFEGILDSSEVVANVIAGNLICQNNTPAAQIGDSEGASNIVGGKAIGECSSVTS